MSYSAGWMSRAGGALSINIWDHKVRFACCEPILCAVPGASSSCFSVKCWTFEPGGSGWVATSSVVPLYCSGLTQQACYVNQLSRAGWAQRVRGAASGSAGSDFSLLALGHGVHGTRGSNRQRVQRTRMRSVRAAQQRLFRHRVYIKLLLAQQYVLAQQKAAVCIGGPKV
jgi:hypothetical protein